MTSHVGFGRIGAGFSLAISAGTRMTTISRMHSPTHAVSIPRYGKMPTGASPASAFVDFFSAGRIAVLNSSHGDDHSTSSRGGSGQRSCSIRGSGMVTASDTNSRNYLIFGESGSVDDNLATHGGCQPSQRFS